VSAAPPTETTPPAARPAPSDPDRALVAAARRDPRAFADLYDRYFARVHAYVRLRIADRALCEDVTSEVFVTALDRLASFRGSGSFAAWLFRIARNAVITAHRRARESDDDGALAGIPDPSCSPEDAALELERRRQLRRLVAELGEEQQHLLALRYGAALSYEEIAPLVGRSPAAARVAVHRIVEHLRGRYEH
jgi:RNA polymerase sigma-70 factor (ECF subfamily)